MFTTDMTSTHPRKPPSDTTALNDCIAACLACEQACTACADACLAETLVHELRACIRINQDCADICSTTGRSLSRLTAPDLELIKTQVELLLLACVKCGLECEKHASMHAHCRVCAAACERCAQACRRFLGLPVR